MHVQQLWSSNSKDWGFQAPASSPQDLESDFLSISSILKKILDEYIMSLPDTPPTPSYVAANNNSILDWTVTSSRALPEELS